MSEYITPIIALLVAIIAALPGLIALRNQRLAHEDEEEERNAQAKILEEEITERVLTRANKEIETLTHRLSEMERGYNRKIKRIEEENANLRLDNTRLRRRIRELENKLGEL